MGARRIAGSTRTMRTWLTAALALAFGLGVAGQPPGRSAQDPAAAGTAIERLQHEGQVLLDRQKFEEALQVYREILTWDREHPQAFIGSIMVLLRQGRSGAADEVLASLGSADGPGRTYGRALARFIEGRIDKAGELARAALDGYTALGHPAGEAASRTLIGNMHLRLGRPDAAADEYGKAAALLARLGDRQGQADILDNLGGVEYERDRPRDALVHYRAALELRRDLGDKAGEAKTWNNLGLALRALGDTSAAIEALEQSLDLRRSQGDTRGEARTLDHLGLARMDLGDIIRAVESFTRAAEISRRAEDDRGLANSLTNLGLAYLSKGDVLQALRAYEEALAIRQHLGDEPGEVEGRRNLAAAYEARGNLTAARVQTEAALAIARKRGDHRIEGLLMRNLGVFACAAGKLEEGLQALRQSRQILQAVEDRVGEAETLEESGNALLASGDSEGARESFESALALFREAGNRPGQASALDRLGVVKMRFGQFTEAGRHLEESRRLALEAGDRRALAAATNDLANMKFALGDLTEALKLQNAALALQRERLDREGEVSSLNNLAAIDHALGRPQRAIDRIRESLLVAGSLPDRRTEAMLRNNLGLLLAETGRPEEALVEQRRSAEIRRELGDLRGKAFTSMNLAETLRRLGRTGEAASLLREAQTSFQELRDVRGEVLARVGLADVLSGEGRRQEAIAAYREATSRLRGLGLREEEAYARAGLAAALEAVGQPAGALDEYLRAIELVETTRARLASDPLKISYFEDKTPLYRGAIRLLVDRFRRDGDTTAAARAFEINERARARALLELLAESRADLRRTVDGSLLHGEATLLARIATSVSRVTRSQDPPAPGSAEEIDSLQEQLDLLKAKIRESSPAYSQIRYPDPVTLDEVQTNVLRDGEVLLEYSLGDKATILWEVGKRNVFCHLLPPGKEIEARATKYAALLAEPGHGLGDPNAFRRVGEELGKLLLPLAHPASMKRLLIVPDGALHHLPFETLIHRGAFLVEHHEIVYQPSASTLRWARRSKPQPRAPGFLGIGNPTSGSLAGLAPLPHSREELERSSAYYPRPSSRLLLGGDATKTALRSLGASRFGVVHFASHAIIDEANPTLSGVLLSGEAPGDDLLTLNEIFGLSLNTDLVVLSACRTARGRLVEGEGIVGMTRGFLFAGAKAVSVSLWNVNDRSTADFMERFHRDFSRGIPPSTALRNAKLKFLSSDRPGYRDPGRWAPFILVGAPD